MDLVLWSLGLHSDPDRYVPLILPVIVACAARPMSERLPPRVATWLLTVTSLALATAGAATLALVALGGALQIPEVAHFGHLSLWRIRHSGQSGPPVAFLAGLALGVGFLLFVRTAYGQVRAFMAAARAAREMPGEERLVIMDDDVPEAFALPGRPGRVVVSSGMLDALDSEERKALLAHENAHLDGRHHLFRTAVNLAAAINPLLRPVRGAVIYATERWADERAAVATGDRRVAARAIGKAALAARARAGTGRGVRVGTGSALLNVAGPGPVPRRVAALLSPPRRRAWRIGFLAALAAGVMIFFAVDSAQDDAATLHTVVEHAQTASPGDHHHQH
jgi:Zn-dependent protease with chaperone function